MLLEKDYSQNHGMYDKAKTLYKLMKQLQKPVDLTGYIQFSFYKYCDKNGVCYIIQINIHIHKALGSYHCRHSNIFIFVVVYKTGSIMKLSHISSHILLIGIAFICISISKGTQGKFLHTYCINVNIWNDKILSSKIINRVN